LSDCNAFGTSEHGNMNDYLMEWWRHNCVTTHVTKLWLMSHGYLQFETITTDCFLECVGRNRLFSTFTESDLMFVFSGSYREIFYQYSDQISKFKM